MATSDYVTKGYVDAVSSGINYKKSRPTSPEIGDAYFDVVNDTAWMWTGSVWVKLNNGQLDEFKVPTVAQLEKHPALKEAWEEFLVVKKLIGV